MGLGLKWRSPPQTKPMCVYIQRHLTGYLLWTAKSAHWRKGLLLVRLREQSKLTSHTSKCTYFSNFLTQSLWVQWTTERSTIRKPTIPPGWEMSWRQPVEAQIAVSMSRVHIQRSFEVHTLWGVRTAPCSHCPLPQRKWTRISPPKKLELLSQQAKWMPLLIGLTCRSTSPLLRWRPWLDWLGLLTNRCVKATYCVKNNLHFTNVSNHSWYLFLLPNVFFPGKNMVPESQDETEEAPERWQLGITWLPQPWLPQHATAPPGEHNCSAVT